LQPVPKGTSLFDYLWIKVTSPENSTPCRRPFADGDFAHLWVLRPNLFQAPVFLHLNNFNLGYFPVASPTRVNCLFSIHTLLPASLCSGAPQRGVQAEARTWFTEAESEPFGAPNWPFLEMPTTVWIHFTPCQFPRLFSGFLRGNGIRRTL
jgi:hypothetical protein